MSDATYYRITTGAGRLRGVKALTDAMARRLEERGFVLSPVVLPLPVITFGRKGEQA